MMKIKMVVGLAFVYGALAGCASQPLAPPQPSLQSIKLLKSYHAEPVNVGRFTLAQGKDPSLDKSVSARATSLVSPDGGSFSKYLRDVLITELRAAGKYDPHSSTVISGQLTENRLDASGISVGDGAVGARFAVRKGDHLVYKKELKAQAQWKSSFVGAIAIPAAVNHYTTLYRTLVQTLFSDEDFRKVTTEK